MYDKCQPNFLCFKREKHLAGVQYVFRVKRMFYSFQYFKFRCRFALYDYMLLYMSHSVFSASYPSKADSLFDELLKNSSEYTAHLSGDIPSGFIGIGWIFPSPM